jgi:hypothetical protein
LRTGGFSAIPSLLALIATRVMSAHHLLQLRIRTEGVDEHPPEPDRVPSAVGGAGSIFLHAAIALVAIWPFAALLPVSNATGAADAANAAKPEPEIIMVSPEALAATEEAKNANNKIPENLGLDLDDDTPHDPAFDYKIGKIVDRASRLYPFLTQPLALDPPKPSQRPGGSLTNPFEPASSIRTPLQLTDRELQKVIDSAWSRRHRWEPFQPIAALANAHDASDGQLPRLLREYVEQNGLQPYVDGATRDGRLWVQLGLAADHADFIGYITRYVREHAGTKASVELLFLLEKLAEASLDALVTLIDIDRQRDLGWTMRTHRFAYAAIVTLQDHYKSQLAQMTLTSRDDLVAYYDRIRLMILQAILDHAPGGYRATDARFLIGSILWKRGKLDDAERVWRQMRVDPADSYADSASRILYELRTWDSGAGNADAHRIDRILNAEQGLWIVRSYERLRTFGYRFDTF